MPKIISLPVGILLLTAALFKTSGTRFDPFFSTFSYYSSASLMLVQYELLLGSFLVFGLFKKATWLLSLLTFSIFSIASFYSGWNGNANCGCFGDVVINPWFVFILDLLIIILLVVWRPQKWREVEGVKFSMIHFVTGIAVSSLIIATILFIYFEDFDKATAWFRGESLVFSPRVIDFGSAKQNQTLKLAVSVTNGTDGYVRIIGGTSNCSCSIVEDLPVIMKPGESVSFQVSYHTGRSRGLVHRQIKVLSDHLHQRAIPLEIIGYVESDE